MAAVQRHVWLRAAWACCPSLWALETTVKGADHNCVLPHVLMGLEHGRRRLCLCPYRWFRDCSLLRNA